MHYQPNLKGSSAPLVFIVIIVILIIGGFFYFTAKAPKENLPAPPATEKTPPSAVEPLPSKEAPLLGEEGKKTEVMPAPEPSVKSFDIEGKNFVFSQSEIRVKKGDKVRINFTSTDGFHNWTMDGFNVATKQVNTGESASVEFTADKAGTFEYYCSVGNHRQLGMKGNFIVE